MATCYVIPQEVHVTYRPTTSKIKMRRSMKVEITMRETIKPSSPTPHHLRNFKLSLLDQLAPIIYTPLVLLYPFDGNGDHTVKSMEKSQRLKKSLSETLTRFYPLAGRIKDAVYMDCNDEGVDYLEARVKCRLCEILERPEAMHMNALLPIDVESAEAGSGRVLLVQASFFECGGMAIGISISHKVADAATISTFIKGWAMASASASASASEVVLPKFNATSAFPPMDSSIKLSTFQFKTTECSTRRYVFDASKLSLLKKKASSASVPQPTRVEAVSALIWKCAMSASRSNLGFVRPSVFSQIVNMRKRIEPPLPDNSFGNFIGLFVAEEEESEVELHSLVSQLREKITEFSQVYMKILAVSGSVGLSMICEIVKEAGNLVKGDEIDFYTCSSWTKLSLYEADFGWGKPTWVSLSSFTFSNFLTLMDTKDGDGIEAWVSLSEEDMAFFERDQEMLAFASLNPSVAS